MYLKAFLCIMEGCCMQIMSRSQVNDDDYYSNRFIYHILVYICSIYIEYMLYIKGHPNQSAIFKDLNVKSCLESICIWYNNYPRPERYFFGKVVRLIKYFFKKEHFSLDHSVPSYYLVNFTEKNRGQNVTFWGARALLCLLFSMILHMEGAKKWEIGLTKISEYL